MSSSSGQAAEQYAVDYLLARGLKLVERNYRCKAGEVDLIMREQDTLVFVEVRFRKSNQYGSPLATITAAKQNRIRRTAQLYIKSRALGSPAMRFDAIGLSPSARAASDYAVNWCKNAF